MEDWIKRTNVYLQWQEVKRAVDDHKWYESERVGHDIGWDRAYTDWLIRHSGRSNVGGSPDA